MKLRLTELRLRSRAYARGVVDIFTDSPVAPWVVRVPIDGIPAEVSVPTTDGYECLLFAAFVEVRDDSGGALLTACGTARVTDWSARSVTFTSAKGSPRNALGTLEFEILGAPPPARSRAALPYPERPATRALMQALIDRTGAWYASPLTPLVPELANVHVPKFPCQYLLPGFAFAAQTPVAFEPEQLFLNALKAAARRRGWDEPERRARESAADAAVLAAECLAAVTNSCVYNEDEEVDEATGKPKFTEAFDPDARAVLSGDCEDWAREVLNLAWSLTKGTYTSELVRLAQSALRGYVPVELFGLVNMDPEMRDESLRKYAAMKGSPLLAHAFVLFLPKDFVRRALTGGARLAGDAEGGAASSGAAGVLVQDGISLTDPHPFEPTHPLLAMRTGLGKGKARVDSVVPTGAHYYEYLSSCMLIDGSVVSASGAPVRELGFVTRGARYGASLADVLAESADVSLVSTCPLSQEEDAAVVRCARYFHPIVPYRAMQACSLPALEAALGAARVSRPSGRFEGTFFVKGRDAADPQYLAKLAMRVPEGARLEYFVDAFGVTRPGGEACFTAQVYVYT